MIKIPVLGVENTPFSVRVLMPYRDIDKGQVN